MARRLTHQQRQQLGLPYSWTPQQLADALVTAGVKDERKARLLIAIAYHESGWLSGMENDNVKNGKVVSVDRGPWQINSKAWPSISASEAHQVGPAAQAASTIYDKQGPTAWVAYDTKRSLIETQAKGLQITMGKTGDGKVGASSGSTPEPKKKGEGDSGGLIPGVPDPGDLFDEGSLADKVTLSPGEAFDTGKDITGAIIGAQADLAQRILGGIPGLSEAGKALATLTSKEFWRRAGYVALGALLLVFGLSALNRDEIKAVAEKGADAYVTKGASLAKK